MQPKPNIVHIIYSGIGGEASVFFPLARAGQMEATQHALFYGIEPMAPAHRTACLAANIPFYAVQKQPGIDRGAQQAITDYLLDVKPSAVIVHTLSTLPACFKAQRQLPGLRIIAVEHHANALKNLKRWLLSLTALWRADAVVYLTETYRAEVLHKLRFLTKFQRHKTHVIGNSLDLADYPQHTPTTVSQFTFGMQGRMVEGKDYATLLRALHLANQGATTPLTLEFAGDGPLRPSLESLAEELGVRSQVTFLGLLSKPDLIARMATWQAYAHASDGETMSISIMEAKACGLPMVVSDVPGINNFFVHESNGLLVPPRTPAAFGQAMLRLQQDPALCQRLSANARQEAEANYSSRTAWLAFSSLLLPPVPIIATQLKPHAV